MPNKPLVGSISDVKFTPYAKYGDTSLQVFPEEFFGGRPVSLDTLILKHAKPDAWHTLDALVRADGGELRAKEISLLRTTDAPSAGTPRPALPIPGNPLNLNSLIMLGVKDDKWYKVQAFVCVRERVILADEIHVRYAID